MVLHADCIPGIPSGDWSMGGAVYCFPVAPGVYSAEIGYFDSTERSILSLTCTLSNQSESGAPPDPDAATPLGNPEATESHHR